MMRRVSRPVRIGLIVVGVVVFLVVSAGVARVLGANSSERSAVVHLVEAQARGDERAVLAGIEHCREQAACRTRVEQTVARLRKPGRVEVLRYDASTRLALGDHVGEARIAWRIGEGLPIVQCARVHRVGGPFSAVKIEILALTAPIDREGSC